MIVNTEFLSIFLAITILHQVNVSNTSFKEILPMSKLIRILSLIKENCGDVCDTTDNFMKITGTYFDKIVKQIDWQALFHSHLIESNGPDPLVIRS